MSNLWFNIRFGSYHFQWGPDGATWRHNPVHDIYRKAEPHWRWFEVYCWFGKHMSPK